MGAFLSVVGSKQATSQPWVKMDFNASNYKVLG